MTEASDIKPFGKTSTVSAIVPVYNVENYLARCVDSLLSQTLPFQEIILIDDGSTDSSGDICDLYDREFDVVRVIHQENKGLSGARNAGIEVATGKFLTFVDSDDWISPVFNEVLFEGINKADADIAVARMVRADDSFKFPPLKFESCKYRSISSDEYMNVFLRIRSNRCVHYAWGKLYRREVIECNHFPEGILNEDVEGFFKSLLNSRRIIEVDCPSPLYCYYRNQESITGNHFGQNYLGLSDVWLRIRKLALQRSPELLKYVDYNIRRTDFTILCDALIHGDKASDCLYKNEIKAIRNSLKSNLNQLLKDPMVTSRKISAVVIAYGYPLVRLIVRQVR